MPARTSSFLLFFLPSFGELLKKKFGFMCVKHRGELANNPRTPHECWLSADLLVVRYLARHARLG